MNIHTVFESCKSDAISMNLAVAGSELVGLVPLECILDIAKFYMEKEVSEYEADAGYSICVLDGSGNGTRRA